MRTLLCIVCIYFCISPASAFEADKQKHFYGSSGGTLVGSVVLRQTGVSPLESILYSSLIVFSAGLLKEATDPRFDGGDIAANGAGIASGGLAAGIVFQL